MTTYFPPKVSTQYIFYASLVSQANTKLMQVNPTIAAGDFKVSIDGGALANLGTLPTVTPAAGAMVKFTLSTSEMAGANATVVCSDAAGAEWCDATFNIQTTARQIDDLAYPATSGRSMVVDASGLVDANAVKLGPTGSGTAQTARDVGASVLLSTGTGTGQLDFTSGVVKANATQWLGGTIPAVNVTGVPLVDAKYLLGTIFSTPATAGIIDVNVKNIDNDATSASGTVTFPNATIASTTNITAGTITTTTNLTNLPTIPANWLTAAGTAADFGTEIAASVWQDAVAGDFTVASSIGKALYVSNVAPGGAGGHFIAGTNAATSITTALTANIIGNLTGNLVGTVSTLTTYTGNTPQTGDAYAVVNSGTFGNSALKTLIDTLDDFVDTEVAAIKAKTDNLPAAPAAVSDIPTANANADALLDRAAGIETGTTLRQGLRLFLASLAGKLSGAATPTVTIRDKGDSKDRIVATVDADGNRSAITYDVT